MKMADEIIEELWKIKDGIAQEYGFNLDSLVAHLKARELSAGQKVVDLRAEKETVTQSRKRKNQRQKIAEPGAWVDGGKLAEALRGKVPGRRNTAWSLDNQRKIKNTK